jgi:hypothetical protein
VKLKFKTKWEEEGEAGMRKRGGARSPCDVGPESLSLYLAAAGLRLSASNRPPTPIEFSIIGN